MTKIAVFVGSLQEKSFNKLLAKNIENVAPGDVEFDYINIASLPLFNQDLEADFPSSATVAKEKVEAADGVLFVTPEYNRSIPGVLKNAIDWTSRPWGDNSFSGKPTGIIGASPSPVGTAVAQADLRHIIAYLGTKLLGQPEIYFANAHELFNEQGELTTVSKEQLTKYVNIFVQWVEDEK